MDIEAKCQALQETLEELEESRSRYADLYDFAPVGYMTLDAKGCIKEINLTGAALLGREQPQLIGMPMSAFILKSDLKRYLDHIHQCRLTSDKVVTELNLAVKNSGAITVQLLSVRHKVRGGSDFSFKTVITDITERKYYEKELARLDRLNLVGEMAASIGHEIRNPMTTIRGFLQMVKERDDTDKYREYYDLMIEELDRANSIITDYLSLARGKKIDLKPGFLDSIVKTLYPMLEANASLHDKQVRLDLGLSPKLMMDENEIRQLIMNLARNGLESMQSGGLLTIGTLTKEDEAVLFIRDEGPGIDSQVLEKIGTPFLTTKENGTGLGLAVCYSIAARHNARIEVDSSSTGTTFMVRFGCD
ncbi:MAG: PAS domain S-box protein [Firmicutes bacterium]|nr:PAS domain S-box protein [Bacillota bacterium]